MTDPYADLSRLPIEVAGACRGLGLRPLPASPAGRMSRP